MTRRLRIVIADDEDDIRRGFCRLLAILGCQVVGEASNGRELIELCIAEEPDLVITDIRMPILSGLEAASEIAKTTQTPVIVVSSYEQPSGDESQFFVDFLQKPVSVPDLESAIAKACPEI